MDTLLADSSLPTQAHHRTGPLQLRLLPLFSATMGPGSVTLLSDLPLMVQFVDIKSLLCFFFNQDIAMTHFNRKSLKFPLQDKWKPPLYMVVSDNSKFLGHFQ